MKELTHVDNQGRARMVDVTEKPATTRTATAEGFVYMNPETLELVKTGGAKKGDVAGVAHVAGIMAAKRTHELVPLCHSISLTGVELQIEPVDDPCAVRITASTRCKGETGVEMEALTAVSVAALTVYDMLKAVQRDMRIGNIRLLSKTGGKSGVFTAAAKEGEA